MTLYNYDKYKFLTDSQLVDLITTPPYDEEAACYLFHVRYDKLLRAVFSRVFVAKPLVDEDEEEGIKGYQQEYKDAIAELFLHMKGRKSLDWHNLKSYDSEKPFKQWIAVIAARVFRAFKFKIFPMIRQDGEFVSRVDRIDNMTPKRAGNLAFVSAEASVEQNMRKAIVLESINELDEDDKLVILKRFEGYKGKEIADILRQSWEERGVKKNNRNGGLVEPDEFYVNEVFHRARKKLAKIYKNKI